MEFRETYYDIEPRIVRTGRRDKLTLRPRFDHSRFDPEMNYYAAVVPALGLPGQTKGADETPQPVAMRGGRLTIPVDCPIEQEYRIQIVCGNSESTGAVSDDLKSVGSFSIYAVDNDLFDRVPLKGDFHLHSNYSDGWETPAYVAASCRKLGLDFMAITDHAKYAPSLEAIKAFEGVDIDLKVFPGEEVHPPGNEVHIVNFGGRYSINALFDNDEYRNELHALAGSMQNLPAGMDPGVYASAVWCFEKIRDAGGLGVFCHPYWATRNRLVLPIAVTDLLFERQPFDALELISGYFKDEAESNLLQVARYSEEREAGKRIPVVGASDAHGCERGSLFGWYYAIVFSQNTELKSIIDGVKDLYSVAVEAVPGGRAGVHGPIRLVAYSLFLLKYIFPLHDELCVEEGRLMLAHAEGEPKAAQTLASLSGRTSELYRRLWSRS